MGCLGGLHLEIVHRCLTTNGCHGADAVRARCSNALVECACGAWPGHGRFACTPGGRVGYVRWARWAPMGRPR